MDRDSESKSPLGGQAEEVEEVPDLDIWAAAKKWHRIVWYCFGLTSCIMMYGYDYVIVGTVSAMPSFQYALLFALLSLCRPLILIRAHNREDYGQKWGNGWILPSLWLGLWNFASPGASMVGAILGGFMQDWTGRRMCIAVGSFLSAIGVAILFVSNLPADITSRRVVFLVGKGFQGMAIGMVLTTTQTYMSEVLPPILRGSVIAFIPTFVLLGQLIGAGVIYGCTNIKDGYIICFGTQWLFSAVPMVVAYIIPESPTYLIRKERFGDALKAQEKLFSPGMDSQAAIDDIRHNIDHEREQANATYLDCFRGTNRRRSLIIMFSNLLPQFFGLLILSKASYFAQVVGMKAKLSLIVLVFGILAGFIANLISIWVISKYGRRLLILLSLSVAGVLWASMGVAGIWSGPVVIW
jgi:MFS family permease